jgi:hypothetical protein
VGDHGVEGIQTYERDHKCQHVCRALGLPRVKLSSPVKNTAEQGSTGRMTGAEILSTSDIEDDEQGVDNGGME